MMRWLRYHRRRVAFLWRLGNPLPYRLLCIVGIARSPSWAMVSEMEQWRERDRPCGVTTPHAYHEHGKAWCPGVVGVVPIRPERGEA